MARHTTYTFAGSLSVEVNEKDSGSGTRRLFRATAQGTPFPRGMQLATDSKEGSRHENWGGGRGKDQEARRETAVSPRATGTGGRREKRCVTSRPAENRKIPFCDSRQSLFLLTW